MPTAHAVFDSASLVAQEIDLARERVAHELRQQYIAQLDQHCSINEKNLVHMDKQAGRKLTLGAFEAKLKKLLPELLVDTNYLSDETAAFLSVAKGASTRRGWLPVPVTEDNPKGMKYLGSWINTPMLHELAVFITRDKYVPVPFADTRPWKNPETGRVQQVPFINTKDLRTEINEQGREVLSEGEQPGRAVLQEPCGYLPGWRSVLLKLLGEGLLTPAQVENEFGTINNESWSAKLGQQNLVTAF